MKLELLQGYMRGFRERYRTFECQAKEKVVNKPTLIPTKHGSRKKQWKRFHGKFGNEPDVLDELLLVESYRINHLLPIIDSLISTLSQRIALYSGLSIKFGFFAKLVFGEIFDGNLCSGANNLFESYTECWKSELEAELVHSNAFSKGVWKEGFLSDDNIRENGMLLFIVDNAVYEPIFYLLKTYLCMLLQFRRKKIWRIFLVN